MATVTVCFTIDSDRDRDLVRWMDGLTKGRRSEAIREILRMGLGHGQVTLADVYQIVKELQYRLRIGAAVIGDPPSSEEWDEPPEAAAALDTLGL